MIWIVTKFEMVVRHFKGPLISNLIKFRPTAFELNHAKYRLTYRHDSTLKSYVFSLCTSIEMAVQLFERPLISNFIKFRPTAFELDHTNGRLRDKHDLTLKVYAFSLCKTCTLNNILVSSWKLQGMLDPTLKLSYRHRDLIRKNAILFDENVTGMHFLSYC
jgi:hypothetical protein